MDMYREHLLDHYHNPRGKGLVEDFDVQAEEYNQTCGDRVIVQLQIQDGVVLAMHFDGHGCAISQAAASLLTESLVGKNMSEVEALGLKDIEVLLGTSLTPMRVRCALLPLSAAKNALKIPTHVSA